MKPTPQPKPVTCATCRHFVRDTSGLSRRNDTGEYFMGTSDIGCNPDNTHTRKIFADKPRLCPRHQHN